MMIWIYLVSSKVHFTDLSKDSNTCCEELKPPTEEPATAATAATAAKGPASPLPVSWPLPVAEFDKSELVVAELLLDTLEAAKEVAPLAGVVAVSAELGSAADVEAAEAAAGWAAAAEEVEAEAALAAEAEVGTSSS